MLARVSHPTPHYARSPVKECGVPRQKTPLEYFNKLEEVSEHFFFLFVLELDECLNTLI